MSTNLKEDTSEYLHLSRVKDIIKMQVRIKKPWCLRL